MISLNDVVRVFSDAHIWFTFLRGHKRPRLLFCFAAQVLRTSNTNQNTTTRKRKNPIHKRRSTTHVRRSLKRLHRWIAGGFQATGIKKPHTPVRLKDAKKPSTIWKKLRKYLNLSIININYEFFTISISYCVFHKM